MNLAKNLEMSAFYFLERPAISEDSQETSYPVYGRNEVQSLAAATEISCPILVVEGEKSVNRHLIDLKAAAAELPHGSYRLVADAGHLIPMEKPEEIIKIIADFLLSL